MILRSLKNYYISYLYLDTSNTIERITFSYLHSPFTYYTNFTLRYTILLTHSITNCLTLNNHKIGFMQLRKICQGQYLLVHDTLVL